MKVLKIGFFISLLSLIALNLIGQEKAFVFGNIYDENQQPLEFVNISVVGSTNGTSTGKNGFFELIVPANAELKIGISHIGFLKDSLMLKLKPGEKKHVIKNLYKTATNIPQIEVIDNNQQIGIDKINIKSVDFIPAPMGGGIEQLIKFQGLGVYSNNELSSQYSVRGGNFDENLVYVNDVEIYRPFLNKAGEQEGLSFVNSDLTSNVEFSSGGFAAKYGDKMSSVLDIQYKTPKKFAGSFMLSLLGVSAHLEGASKNQKVNFLFGVRQKSNQYMLKSMQTKGQYKPSFTDIQANVNYNVSKKLTISVLGNYSRNKYLVIPESRETQFGTVQETYKLKIFFDGNEIDKINTYLGALSINYLPNIDTKLKFIFSAYNTSETDYYDIQGQYWIGKLENNMGDEDFAEVKEIIGVGTHLNHARDELYATVYSGEFKGTYFIKKHFIQWGVKYQFQHIDDKLREWQMIDSSGYSLPHPADSVGYTNPLLQSEKSLFMQDVVISNVTLNTSMISAYIQDVWDLLKKPNKLTFNYGVRAFYWDFNNQFCVSPRLTLKYKPELKQDVSFKFSTGIYHQPPFYKELRNFSGEINRDIKAQTAVHFVLGSELNFKIWERPFKFVAEAYYKYLYNLIPYEVENIQIKYYGKNCATGYAYGIDTKIHGEFVPDAISWIGLSLMQTKENIEDDYYYNYYNKEGELIIKGYTRDQVVFDSVRQDPGYIPRPTDQLLNLNVFFQDYIPKYPQLKAHINLVYGTPLPFGPPEHHRYKDTLRMPAYFRVDIGFTYDILTESQILPKQNPFHVFKSIMISAEVYNLFGRLNTISYIWIKDVNGRNYAVPNSLTPRLFNLKLLCKF